MPNSISDAKALFDESVAKTQAVAKGKEVWITETGWPVSGNTENLAVANLANAKTYWDEVGCPLFGKTNTWWYILQDADPVTPNPSFGIVGSTLSTTPLFDLSCSAASSSAAASSTAGPSASSVAGSSASGFATVVSSGSAKPTFSVGKGPGGSYNGSYPGSYLGSWNASSAARPSSTAISASSGSSSSGSGASSQSSSSTGSFSSPSSFAILSNSASGLSSSIFGAVVAVCLALAAL